MILLLFRAKLEGNKYWFYLQIITNEMFVKDDNAALWGSDSDLVFMQAKLDVAGEKKKEK